jgi:glycoside/pentoside/hexuronide:cation symporter, GPH family
LAFLAKLALALAAAITLPYLQSVGFKPGQESTKSALHALNLSYAIIPCFIKLISIYLLWRMIHEKNDSHTRGSNDYD